MIIVARLLTVVLILLASNLRAETLDLELLDKPISIKLYKAALDNAIGALARIGDLGIVTTAESSEPISLSLERQPLRTVLDGLATASGTTWCIFDGVIIFRKPAPDSAIPEPPKPGERLTAEQSMTRLIASLDQVQFQRAASGLPLAYDDLRPEQQEVAKIILNEADPQIPPELYTISFVSLPYLVVGGDNPTRLRLDSRPYNELRRADR